MTQTQFRQEPVAVIGFACRLPGENNSPQELWDFLERGGIASNNVPKTRFNIDGHYDGSHKPGTMRPKGGMFIGSHDMADFDASFFEIGGTEAVAMDPNQRQMLEVVYEGLENAGIPLEKIDGQPVGCYVASYASDYGDMQNRDAEDRPANCAIGVGRSIMANRLSYFLNVKGPSITIDTACSGSLVGLDLACRSVQSGEVSTAIVAASNLYLNPDHVMDAGNVGQAHSPTALCHTFDADADGYVKAEAVSCVIVKNLSAAIRDRDPIRGIVRGTASNSNGRTGGIASPSHEAQAAAIRSAYANAGITSLHETAYLECHGTGTQAGDPTEVRGAGSVFAATRVGDNPLLIGSIKSNIGHSEPAAGNSGLLKVIMSMEKGVIPGTPLFIKPSTKIDFKGCKVQAFRTAVPWPDQGYSLRRASINSFGYGGSNAHAIVEQASLDVRSFYRSSYAPEIEDEDYDEEKHCQDDDEISDRPYTLVVSANDAQSLRENIRRLTRHLVNPRVRINLADLAATLSQRRSRLWHRAFLTTRSTEIEEKDFVVGKNRGQAPKIAFVFTGQGAQWPQMGKELLQFFPWTRAILEELDAALQSQPDPPKWSLVAELTEPRSGEHLRQPEYSQPLVTALQLCIFAVLETWGVCPSSVVGHSSGEIAAAYAAGYLDRASAIKAAFYRGRAALNCKSQGRVDSNVGMLAIGLGSDATLEYLDKYKGSAWIACFNSPSSVTVSGERSTLNALAEDIKAQGHFARALQVDLAYHSELMGPIGEDYFTLLQDDVQFKPLQVDDTKRPLMFSSVTGSLKETTTDVLYWKTNMVSPVRFSEALTELVNTDAPTMIIEIGPSGALAGPTLQVLKALPNSGDIQYCAAWARGASSGKALFDVAGHLFAIGAPIDFAQVNEYIATEVRTLVDLPNYSWNHSIKYWHENTASHDWRYKPFITHDLLGSKIPGTAWESPTWRKHLKLADVPWLRDHKMGPDVLIPGAGLATMALEAMYQKYCALNPENAVASPNELAYRFRNVKFERAVVVEESKSTTILLSLMNMPGSHDWHEFRIRTTAAGVIYEHCSGFIRIQDPIDDDEALDQKQLAPIENRQSAQLWYKTQQEVGMGFGPSFQTIKSIESVSGSRTCRTIVSLEPPASKWDPQSYYPFHPAILDGCLQTATPANAAGERSLVKDTMIPALVDDMIINKVPRELVEGLSVAESLYTGRGRRDVAKSWTANISIYHPQTGALLLRVRGLNYIRLDVDEKPDFHVFSTPIWKPDISLLTQDQLMYLTPSSPGSSRLDMVLDLVAQKVPTLQVLEVSMDETDKSSLWLQRRDKQARSAYRLYHLASPSATSVANLNSTHESKPNTEFHLLDFSKDRLGLTNNHGLYDLLIFKAAAEKDVVTSSASILERLKILLTPAAFVLVITPTNSIEARSDDLLEDELNSDINVVPLEESSPSSGSLTPSDESSFTSLGSVNGKSSMAKWTGLRKLEGLSQFGQVLRITPDPGHHADAHLWRPLINISQSASPRHKQLIVARFHADSPTLSSTLKALLKPSGWSIRTVPITKLATEAKNSDTSQSVVVVMDELFKPVLTQISESQWEALKMVISTGQPLLWVTKGGQTSKVSDPDNALVHGLFRVVRREDPQANLTTLDVQSATSPATSEAIYTLLQRVLDGTHGETEYAERDGILLMQRLIPDRAINEFKAAEDGKVSEPVVRSLHETAAQVRLQAEKVGTLQSLTWCETAVGEVPMEPGMVEIEVMAVGVNFKVRPNFSSNCDRVAAMRSGTYANRVQCPFERVHRIPDSMSYDEASTIPLVYLTAIYSLYHLGNLQAGQSVLIHSAAGGVGLAAIQLAQHKKCDVFVTVGTEAKRQFLARTFNIPENRMFSSRSTRFAEEIRRETDGRGVDVILNSLTGELLDESWRLTADGGIMVEIGKRDIVDRNSLAMEPFDRNCSFRAVDLSYTREITNELIGNLLGEIFDLINGGHVGPINPITRYPFEEVIPALSYMRSGKHMGKIVISGPTEGTDLKLPIRPAVPTLRLDPAAAYLIVGGLRGLCGSLAVYLARQGARCIISISRSGIQDPASARAHTNCAAYGCEIVEAKGDVADLDFVQKVFRSIQPRRVAGLIQGAMVLRDKPYETMTHDDYITSIHAKIAGTWNLHLAAQQEQPQPLDFFTMLSSISSVVGNKGQANYAAGNAFLDAFASYRNAGGLRANTINLGLIEDVGYVAEQGGNLEARFDRSQWVPINEGMLRRILSYSILQQQRSIRGSLNSAQLITGLAYPLVANSSAELKEEARFGFFFSNHSIGSGGGNNDNGGQDDPTAGAIKALHLLHASQADITALSKAALGLLQMQLIKILRLEAEMEPGKPLMAYGLDSLSAVELRGWVRQKTGAELSTLDITNASSLTALSDKLVSKLPPVK
ncbi:Acyl transferase/acyl hydrolase/lysophospholipase [Penicillium verhagenii]|uniref:Acyl transferase/acyl hydrolase/lysophospholipase n=1 Tax=Penicillium verhagenii TaxID=1562060 RepID=UPI0025455C81|nr:Acyl transferase/acyl hydrolase/lysophospholipase [Penicillium verhagenii]KAJ5936907.1 Acyl transferase/acyl hydrolase/lysophospholipase [Penicillium verhagenii]